MKRSLHLFRIPALALVMLVMGCQQEMTPPPIPNHQLDPALAKTVQEARDRVVASPKSAEAWGKLGQAFDAADFSAESERAYNQASHLDPLSPRWKHLLGLRQLRESPELALAQLAEAARLAGTETDAPRLRLAQALIERGRTSDATNQLAPLLISNPAHAAARLEMGRASLVTGDSKAALQWLGPCATNPYTARPALVLLGQAAARSGDSENAARYSRAAAGMPKPFDWPDPFLREVQSLRQDRSRLTEQANQLLQQRRMGEAENTLTNLLTRTPNDPEALLLLGRIRIQQRRCDEAESTLKQLLQIQPQSPNGWVQLGMSLYCQSRWLDAAHAFEKATQLKPDFAQAHFNLGLARSRSGNRTGAIQSLRDALRCHPGDANTHATLADELARDGQMAEAESHLSKALALDPNNAKARALKQRTAPK